MIWASALDVSTSKDFDTEDKYLKARKNSLARYSAKINRLIAESQITAIRALKAERHESDGMCNSGFYIDAEDRDKLLAALNKELGDSEAEKNSGIWSRV